MVSISEFHNPRPVFTYEKVGDKLEGPICDQPELQPDKFGDPGDKQLLLAVQMGDTTFRDYSRNQKLQAVGEAVVEARRDRDRGRRLDFHRVGRVQADRRRPQSDEAVPGDVHPAVAVGAGRVRRRRRDRRGGAVVTRVLLIPDTLLGDVLDTLEEDGWRWRRRCGVFVLRTQPPYEDEEFGVA